MNLRSYADISGALRNKTLCHPDDFDLIVGIPRSGLFISLMIAMAWKKPVTDVQGALDFRLIENGTTTEDCAQYTVNFESENLKILLVDDSCHSGASIKRARQALEEVFESSLISTFCSYVSPQSKDLVDFYFEILPPHHIFEWNIGRNMVLEQACVDIDGVLCPDPPYSEETNEAEYVEYIKTAPLLLKPHRRIKYLVTNRLECRREETETWLALRGIQYDELIMHPAHSIQERALRDSFWHKSEFYSKCDAHLFIESEMVQATAIWKSTGKPVLSFENFSFPEDKKQIYKRGVKPLLLRYIKKLAPLVSSLGRGSGPLASIRRVVVKLLKKHVM